MSGDAGDYQSSRNSQSRNQSYASNPYATRVYNAANAAAMAAQPLLGYLGGGSSSAPRPVSASGTVAPQDVRSYPYVAEGAGRPESAAGGGPSPSRADTPSLPTAMRRAASTEEESRRKDSRNLDSIISVGTNIKAVSSSIVS
jgi:hypothetical protein